MQNESKKRAGRRPFPPKGHADKTDALIGERIRARRERMGFSQARFAETIGLTQQQIQKYERGLNRVSASTLLDIAGALCVDVRHFYDGLLRPVPAVGDGPQKSNGALSSDKRSHRRPDPEAEVMLAFFEGIRSARHRRQLLELARSFVGAGSLQQQRDARLD